MTYATWLPHFHAYAIRREGIGFVGLVKFANGALPFRRAVTFGEAR